MLKGSSSLCTFAMLYMFIKHGFLLPNQWGESHSQHPKCFGGVKIFLQFLFLNEEEINDFKKAEIKIV